MRKLLFITWDGPQVTYLESLFVPIFKGLLEEGFSTEILQFRWGSEDQARAVADCCAAAGLGYRYVTLNRRFGPVGGLASIAAGSRHVGRMISEMQPDIVMPRSLFPAMILLMRGIRRLPRICFDADGLLADERLEFAGAGSNRLAYRMLRSAESAMARHARSVLVRTPFAAALLAERSGEPIDKFHVVTNGRDERLFAPLPATARTRLRGELGISPQAPVLTYVGSVGPQYRIDKIVSLTQTVRRHSPVAKLLMITGSPAEARQALRAIDPSILEMTILKSAAPAEVPTLLALGDLGLSYRQMTLSMRGVAPVKLGEYLMCGLPVAGTEGIGDTSTASAAGAFMDADDQSVAAWLLHEIMPNRKTYLDRARQVGAARFSLSRSIADYRVGLLAATSDANNSTSRGAWDARE